MKKLLYFTLLLTLLAGCSEKARKTGEMASATGPEADAAAHPEIQQALASLTSQDLLRHINVLASDAYEGRSPGTRGEDSTVAYLTRQFKRLGLQPGNPDGSYVQAVPMMGFTGQPSAYFTAGGKKINLNFPQDYVAVSRRFVPQVQVVGWEIIIWPRRETL
jgi:hypothetical protein